MRHHCGLPGPARLRNQHALKRGLVTAAFVALLVQRAGAQSIREQFWIPNGPVNAVAVAGNVVYIGGEFSRIGPPAGGFVAIDTGTGNVVSPYPWSTAA
jgi:hypothetical protein